MWCEAYCCACAVDEETAYLVQEAYPSEQIDRQMAEQLWWSIAASTKRPRGGSEASM